MKTIHQAHRYLSLKDDRARSCRVAAVAEEGAHHE